MDSYVQRSRRKSIRRRLIAISVIVFLVVTGSLLVGACSPMGKIEGPVYRVSFSEYQSETLEKMRDARRYQNSGHDSELWWNAPREWQPSAVAPGHKPKRGILLVHGLGDSPWSFHDVGQELAAQGFLVRTVLLPGHGTDPADMIEATAEQWQKVVYQQAHALASDVEGEVYLGGFSTGANLILDYAYQHPEVAGLVLFSPGFKSMPFDWLAPLVSKVRPWIITPGEGIPTQTPVRYLNVPTNGYAQFYRTSVAARKLLEQNYEKPVFMVVAEHDSVLNTDYLLDIFQDRFTHPKSRLIWYGDKPEQLTENKRVLIREDHLPEHRISQFSHMGVLFSPENPLYGREGSLRICLNGMDGDERKACQDGADVWFSGWGYSEEGKVHARLTFNPYFQWQTSVMLEVLGIEPRDSEKTAMQAL
ncbi:alpha/beta fold hydrolase [Microbulbifer litoralis]|uniref:alpha/beta fold hydrolase n=1 Tax=Microbulbifer litoralis TaxID=2933965 RepID=UPI0020289449|nr:alpha/beta fold hydrolase [Microbulbifer sp. GX H0434]